MFLNIFKRSSESSFLSLCLIMNRNTVKLNTMTNVKAIVISKHFTKTVFEKRTNNKHSHDSVLNCFLELLCSHSKNI